jgi:hypothetical protein
MPYGNDFSNFTNDQLCSGLESYVASRRNIKKDEADALLLEVRDRLRNVPETTARFAHVKSNTSLATVEAYLYGNYKAVQLGDGSIFIIGQDRAGFTLNAIIERLASGLNTAVEISAEDYAFAQVVGGFPKEGCTRCACGAKYWDGLTCHSCGAKYNGKDYTEEVRTV